VLSGIVLIAEQRFRAIPICVRVSAPPSAIFPKLVRQQFQLELARPDRLFRIALIKCHALRDAGGRRVKALTKEFLHHISELSP
jgi:hypothetical protein